MWGVIQKDSFEDFTEISRISLRFMEFKNTTNKKLFYRRKFRDLTKICHVIGAFQYFKNLKLKLK